MSSPTQKSENRLVRLVTLGCKVNQYETQYVKETLQANGFHEAESNEPAGLCIVNTCTVTNEGDAKSRQVVRRLHKKNPDAHIVVMGCYATRDPSAVSKLPGVTKVITNKNQIKEDLTDLGVSIFPQGIQRFDGHSRAFVKVQDGCLLNCTYCIIPKVRPTLRSRPVEEIVDEVRGLVASGFQEIVLTGVHLGHYGIDLSKGKPKSQWQRLWHLLYKLADIPGKFRLRLSSMEAAEVRDDLIRAMSDLSGKVVPHLHLCLQSGSDRLLRAMKRRYTSAGFLARCERLIKSLDLPAFTTDVILGFPGETEEDFAATCNLVRRVGFSKIHIFPYSSRQGTEAASLKETVPGNVVMERRKRLEAIESELAHSYYQKLIGRRLDVLVENSLPGQPDRVMGTSCRYAPVILRGQLPVLQGKLIPALAERIEQGKVVGKLAFDQSATEMEFRDNRISLPLQSNSN